MTQATGKRRGHGEDSIYWDESKSRYVGAVSLGFSASGARLRKKVSGRTKTEVRDKLRELHQQVDSGLRPRRRYTVGGGASIIGTSSVNSDSPTPTLLPYDVTKAGIANMTAALAQLLAPRGIRANSVAPGPIWTPLIPSTMLAEHVESFGSSSALDRPGQHAEVAPAYVMPASDEASYISGARLAVTGGKPIL